jgi:type II secretory pathway component PulK
MLMPTTSSRVRMIPLRSRPAGGFALVVVVWVLGLVLLVGTAITVGVRYRTRADSSLFDSQRAELAAESAINLAILLQLSKKGRETIPFPLTCLLPGREQVTMSVTEEAGKVDLNTASPRTVLNLFVALTQDRAIAERIAAAILSNRSSAAAAQAAPATQSKPQIFQSVMELESIEGVTSELFRAALPLMTVRSGKTEPDLAAAPEALRNALGVQKVAAGGATAPQTVTSGEITVRADVSASPNARFIREALVSVRQEHGRPFSIREWRHGDAGEPFLRASKDLQPCFSTFQADGA